MAGTHCGVSIGEDGPSQMALEDLAMMRAVPTCTVLYPCDGVSAERLIALAAATPGRSTCACRVPRRRSSTARRALRCRRIEDAQAERRTMRVTVVAAGVTVLEALKAHDDLAKEGIAIRVIDAYSIQPIDRADARGRGQGDGRAHHHRRRSLRAGRARRCREQRPSGIRPFASGASPSGRSRAADRRRSSSIATAFRHGRSPTPSANCAGSDDLDGTDAPRSDARHRGLGRGAAHGRDLERRRAPAGDSRSRRACAKRPGRPTASAWP